MATQPHHHTLHGACSCGRNRYAINLPTSDADSALIIFDNSSASRRAHSSPVVTYISIPLSYYQSATFAFYPDETHQSIRRIYHVPLTQPSSAAAPLNTDYAPGSFNPQTESRRPAPGLQQRHFCGFCGTHFASWDEGAQDADDRIRIALESVEDESYPTLYALGLLQNEGGDESEGDDADVQMTGGDERVVRRSGNERAQHSGGVGRAYFEEMVGGSRLSRISRVRRTGDGAEWEVEEVEIEESPPGKRKREGPGE